MKNKTVTQKYKSNRCIADLNPGDVFKFWDCKQDTNVYLCVFNPLEHNDNVFYVNLVSGILGWIEGAAKPNSEANRISAKLHNIYVEVLSNAYFMEE